ncbi:MAG TPA: LLM class flavin-dependent oxidoreductase [Gaiellaceae bacterium]|nr:LLM class flavin-dependent oxidoreductase [Gaiellaceae bacterium]
MGTIGAQFLPERFDECVASVKAAEEAGYSHAWFIDSQILWQDCFVYMTRALAATERIVVGTAVTNPYTRHVTTTASAFGTLAELHPGRVELGIGRGDSAVRTMGLNPVRTSFMADSVRLLRDLLAGRHVTINDADVHLRWLDGEAGVPIMMPATGPKNLRLAGSLADRVMLYVGISDEAVRWAMDHVRTGAEQAGRDPDAVRVSVLTAMWLSDDQQEAWDRCRWAPAACANHIADTMKRNPAHGMPEVMTRLPQSRDDYDYYAGHLSSEADHTAYLTGELIDDYAVAGDAEKVRAAVQRLFDLGVDEISCAYLNGDFEQMATVGREVIASAVTGGAR